MRRGGRLPAPLQRSGGGVARGFSSAPLYEELPLGVGGWLRADSSAQKAGVVVLDLVYKILPSAFSDFPDRALGAAD